MEWRPGMASGAVMQAEVRRRGGAAAGTVAAGLIFALALGLRLFGLGSRPLWLDEVFTAQRSALPVPSLIENSLIHHHSPLFFLLEHGMTMMLPGPYGLRLIPAIAGAACAPLVYAIGREAGLRGGALLGGLLAAFAPLQIGFAQEARSYTLVLALVLASLWGLVRLAGDRDRAALPWRHVAAPTGAWTAYGLGLVAALMVHGDALAWLLASNLAMAVAILPGLERRARFLRHWLAVQGLVLLATMPVYAAIVRAEHGRMIASFRWIPPLTWHFVWADIASLYGLRAATAVTMRLLPAPLPALALVAFGFGALGILRLRRAPGPRRVLVIAALGPPLVLAAISLIHPILLPRYLVLSPAPFFVLAGAGIETMPRRAIAPVLAAAAVLLAVNVTPYYRLETKPRWDLAASFLARRLQPQDRVLVADGAAPVMLNTYLDRAGLRHVVLKATRQPDRAAAALAHGGRIYAVYGPAGQGRLPDRAAFFARAEAFGVAGARHAIGDEITIERISPPGRGVVACADAVGESRAGTVCAGGARN